VPAARYLPGRWRLSERRTTLVIAHRLSTIEHAHAIIVMDRGRIVERGTHAELLRRKGVHARLWLLQQRMDQDQARDAATADVPPDVSP
jgi:ATP-binding cassette subfamily B protein